jgi:hypothetical protein
MKTIVKFGQGIFSGTFYTQNGLKKQVAYRPCFSTLIRMCRGESPRKSSVVEIQWDTSVYGSPWRSLFFGKTYIPQRKRQSLFLVDTNAIDVYKMLIELRAYVRVSSV